MSKEPDELIRVDKEQLWQNTRRETEGDRLIKTKDLTEDSKKLQTKGGTIDTEMNTLGHIFANIPDEQRACLIKYVPRSPCYL